MIFVRDFRKFADMESVRRSIIGEGAGFKDLRSQYDVVNSYELRSPEFQGLAESEGRSKSAIFGRDAVSYENPRTPSATRPDYFTIFGRDEVSYENDTGRTGFLIKFAPSCPHIDSDARAVVA
jgi:hypothetical protein